MAYCCALTSDKKIKFIINLPQQQAPKVNSQPVEVIPAPVVIEEAKQEAMPEPPKMVPQVMVQQPEPQNSFVLVPKEEPVAQPIPVAAPVEEVKIEEVKAKKGKNGEKKNKPTIGMPRQALRSLIQQELEKQSTIIFNKIMAEKGMTVEEMAKEESKEPTG